MRGVSQGGIRRLGIMLSHFARFADRVRVERVRRVGRVTTGEIEPGGCLEDTPFRLEVAGQGGGDGFWSESLRQVGDGRRSSGKLSRVTPALAAL